MYHLTPTKVIEGPIDRGDSSFGGVSATRTFADDRPTDFRARPSRPPLTYPTNLTIGCLLNDGQLPRTCHAHEAAPRGGPGLRPTDKTCGVRIRHQSRPGIKVFKLKRS
jgi:hypothetical protein